MTGYKQSQALMSKIDWWWIVIGLAVFGAFTWWDKPTCRAGFVATYHFFSNWACVAGYAPQ